jgi:hypothetical protein
MCRTCNGRVRVQERISYHNFIEQIKEFQGFSPKYFKTSGKKNFKKSLINKIEHKLQKLQIEHELKYLTQLEDLLRNFNNNDIANIKIKFDSIMISYYKEKLEVA